MRICVQILKPSVASSCDIEVAGTDQISVVKDKIKSALGEGYDTAEMLILFKGDSVRNEFTLDEIQVAENGQLLLIMKKDLELEQLQLLQLEGGRVVLVDTMVDFLMQQPTVRTFADFVVDQLMRFALVTIVRKLPQPILDVLNSVRLSQIARNASGSNSRNA